MVNHAPKLEKVPDESNLNAELIDDSIEVFDKYEIEDVPNEVIEICHEIEKRGGRAFLVGGVVRDTVINSEHEMDLTSKDFDIEVFGIDKGDLESMLSQKFGVVDAVGQKFGVFKVPLEGLAEPLDFAVAREENKSGVGHKGFEVDTKPDLTLREASRRRDLALNAMSYDPLTKEVFDPFGGVEDIKNKTINVTEKETFVEDPLRVLRVAQFSARFEYDVSAATIEICSEMVEKDMLQPVTGVEMKELGEDVEGVTPDRISTEFEKLLLKGRTPSRGMEFLDEIGYLDKYFVFDGENGEEIRFTQLKEAEQDPGWHPEGNTWVHTLQCLDAGAEIIAIESADTRIVEFGETVFEKVPSFVTDRQLEGLIKAAESAAESKANGFRRELIEMVLSEIHPEFASKKEKHQQKIETEIEKEFKAYLKRVEESASWKGSQVSESAKNKARAKIKKDVTSKYLPGWDNQLSELFEEMVDSNRITAQNIESLEKEAKRRVEEFKKRKIGLDRINLERDMKMSVMLAVMLHDIGKITTTEFNEEKGRFSAHGHAEEGVAPAMQILDFFDYTRVSSLTKSLVPELVLHHMAPWDALKDYEDYLKLQKFKEENPGIEPPEEMKDYPKRDPRSGLKRRARKLRSLGGNLVLLAMVAESDKRGRRPKEEGNYPLERGNTSRGTVSDMYEAVKFARVAVENEEKAQNVAISGNLIKRVLKPVVGDSSEKGAPFVGVIKKALLAAQDEGEFFDREEGTALIVPTFELFREHVSANSTDEDSERQLWIDLAKMEDPREALVQV